MSLILSLLSEDPFFIFPGDWVGWLGLIAFLGVDIALIRNWRRFQRSWRRQPWLILVILIVFTVVFSLFPGLRLPNWGALPLPGVTIEPGGPVLMFLAALPWMLAAGLFGTVPGAVLGALSGLLIGYWGTHTFFSALEITLLATLFAAATHQRYRTPIYRALRHPVVTATLLSLLYPLLYLISAVFISGGSLASRLDYALTHLQGATVAMGGQLILAGAFAELFKIVYPSFWGNQASLRISPAERRMGVRLFYNVTILAFVLIVVLVVGDWLVAGRAARQMLHDRMAGAAKSAAQAVPFFLDTGQSLIMDLATDPDWNLNSQDQLELKLIQSLRNVPFFHHLFILNESSQPLAGVPEDRFDTLVLSREEQKGAELALNGVLIQVYTIPPMEGGTAAQVSFMAAIVDQNEDVQGVLVGRTDLAINPFTQPLLTSLNSIQDVGGEGFLLDDNGRILYHPDPERVMTEYTGVMGDESQFYDATAPDGTRQLVYYQPAVGRPWAVSLKVPAQHSQQIALNIAAPLLGIIVLLVFVAASGLYLGIRKMTGSLHTLADGSERIAQGDLDHELHVEGEDEIGQLGQAFEQMRVSLKDRLFELNRLLVVSQGVASNLEMENAAQPILESALATGACSARIVLSPEALPQSSKGNKPPSRFGHGSATDLYSYLDKQIMDLTREREQLVLTNPVRTPMLTFEAGFPKPEGLMAVSLRHENTYYGNLWVAYDQPHTFLEEEVLFLNTLASQAALAAAKARLFLNAEIERRRLAAILNSTPDPVLVTDHQGRILLTNPAAWQALGLATGIGTGKPLEQVIDQPELRQLLQSEIKDQESIEVAFPDDHVYLATASSIISEEGHVMGRVCLLRDITEFKNLDELKSEFVATVSHDLRSPLTLMHGYATMMELVGELNEEQTGYIRKIIMSVESMERLVNNLLDLGRIEAAIDLNLEMLSIEEVVEDVVETLQVRATQKRIQVNTQIPDQIPRVQADKDLLQQALHNLVDNAIKFTRSGGKVWIRVRRHQDKMVVEVRDTGIGIAPLDQSHVFEKFYRGASREAKRMRGSGLGLAIVRSIVERHGGEVRVRSQLGQGSTFYVALPLRQPQ